MLDKFIIKHKLNSFFLEKKIHNNKIQLPKVKKIDFEDWGYLIYLDISQRCSNVDIENNLNYLIASLRVIDINIVETNYRGFIVLEVIDNEVERKKFNNILLSPYQLLVGYNLKGEEVILDMKKTPHLAIQGLSNVGKTVLSEYVANNLIFNNADVVLVNSYYDDFKSLDLTRINNLKDIEIYLNFLLTSNLIFETPLYIIIDEINILSRNKIIDKYIENLLEVARHFNIFIIAIGQILLKENIKYKQLFNCRITFKHLDKVLYSSFLNVKQDLIKNLENQEFYVFDENLVKCFCYEFLP